MSTKRYYSVAEAALCLGVSKSTVERRMTERAAALTRKRHDAVFSKFLRFAGQQGIHHWKSVTPDLVTAYMKELRDLGYSDRTIYLELTTVKQANNWLVRGGLLLPTSSLGTIKMRRPAGRATYCFKEDEIRAIIRHCCAHQRLVWLGRVLVIMAYTGMRVGEIGQLDWNAIDLVEGCIRVGSHFRVVPIHRDLKAMLHSLPGERKGRVCVGPRGASLTPGILGVSFKRVLQQLKAEFPKKGSALGFEDGRIRSIRYFFISHCVRCGITAYVLSSWMGHRFDCSDKVRRLYRPVDELRCDIKKFRSLDFGKVV